MMAISSVIAERQVHVTSGINEPSPIEADEYCVWDNVATRRASDNYRRALPKICEDIHAHKFVKRRAAITQQHSNERPRLVDDGEIVGGEAFRRCRIEFVDCLIAINSTAEPPNSRLTSWSSDTNLAMPGTMRTRTYNHPKRRSSLAGWNQSAGQNWRTRGDVRQ
jgi:hypothetical protein